jgi:hypothetical protein
MFSITWRWHISAEISCNQISVQYKCILAVTDDPFSIIVYYHNGKTKVTIGFGLVCNDQNTMKKFQFLYQLFAVLAF